MGFSIQVDWSKDRERFENEGRKVLENNCNHHNKEIGKDENKLRYSGYCEECEVYEDTAEPMMNFIYPLEITPDDEKILEVVKRTNCTVMYDTETDKYFLTLCGGGMDLSQDIALAYIILERWIPEDLITQVCSQKDFSISGKDFEILKNAVIEQSETYGERFMELNKKWQENQK